MAAELSVVHLKIRHRATGLTPPAVATQDLMAQTFGAERRASNDARSKPPRNGTLTKSALRKSKILCRSAGVAFNRDRYSDCYCGTREC